jgi:microcystin-dependent protein
VNFRDDYFAEEKIVSLDDVMVGEVRLFPYDLVPKGWAKCDGSVLPIAPNTALFSLLGHMYNNSRIKDPSKEFALPDLVGVVPIGADPAKGPAHQFGAVTGSDLVALNDPAQLPGHTHKLQRKSASDDRNGKYEAPTGNCNIDTITVIAANQGTDHIASYTPGGVPDTTLHISTVGITGNATPHENRQPYQAMIYCIAVTGVYPTR